MRKGHQVLYKGEVYELRGKRPNKLKTGILCAIKHVETKKILNGVDIDDIDKLPNGVFFRKRSDQDIKDFAMNNSGTMFSKLYTGIEIAIIKKLLQHIGLYKG